MTERRIDVFFYGLFMDGDFLRTRQVVPSAPRRAYVGGYALRIAERATLVPDAAARAYGMLFALTHGEVDALYCAPGLEGYRAEALLAHGLEGGSWPAMCFNLLEPSGTAEANAEYAARLRALLTRLDFPPDYVRSVG